MAEERVQRRLAAVFAADVVGYSRLMQANEAGTLTSLKARRTEILQPLITTHRGPDRQSHGRRRAGGICQRGERGFLRGRAAGSHAYRWPSGLRRGAEETLG